MTNGICFRTKLNPRWTGLPASVFAETDNSSPPYTFPWICVVRVLIFWKTYFAGTYIHQINSWLATFTYAVMDLWSSYIPCIVLTVEHGLPWRMDRSFMTILPSYWLSVLRVRASSAVEGPQAEIRRYLAPDGWKFWPGEAHVSSGEPRALFEFKQKVDEKRRTLTKFRNIYINRVEYRDILHI
jgi:hypothetical protein